VDGRLYTLAYGRTVAENLDPVEKKPLFHFLPGSYAYSIATIGCNFRCRFCQNWQISQALRELREEQALAMGRHAPPDEIVQRALASHAASIAYTYTEPTIFFEYAYDIAKIARQYNLRNVFVTNGYQTPECIDTIAPYLDAANVDLKAFSDKFYRKIVGAKLQPILEALVYMKQKGIWVEVTTLVIPSLNDSEQELRRAADLIANNLGPETPWHVSRFFPAYKMDEWWPTPTETLYRARAIGLEMGLKHVYIGNLPGDDNEDTFCPGCHARLIRRLGYAILENRLVGGQCPECGSSVAGVWA
jgi:pyruvate formate lyase activating enzyme